MRDSRPRCLLLLASGWLYIGAGALSAQGGGRTAQPSRGPDEVWFAFDYSNSVTAYTTLATTGEMRPLRTIAGDLTGLDRPAGTAVDARGALYIANTGNNSITVYAHGAAGNVPPKRTLRGPATGLAAPRGLALDARGRLYVANAGRNRLTVYAPGADGDAEPIRSIWGSRTQLRSPSALAVDRRGAVFVTGYTMGYLLVFAPGANGNARPARDFRSTAYGPVGMKSLSWRGVAFPTGVAFDPGGRLYVVDYGGRDGPEVQLYPHDARGITASLRTIVGQHTGLEYPMRVAVDAGGYVYVLNESPAVAITAYAPGAVGDVAPVARIDGDASARRRPSPWARRDSTPRAAPLPPGVTVYPPGASGDVAPDWELSGARTGLRAPVTLKLAGDGTVHVLDCDGRVRVYPPDARGDAAPLREFGRTVLPAGAPPNGLALDRWDTAFVSFPMYGESISAGWTEVYAPGAADGVSPIRRIEGFAASYSGLALDSLGFLYAGLGESGFFVLHSTRQLPVAEFGNGARAAHQPPGAEASAPRYLPGPDAELFGPGDFALDSGRRLYVPNADDAVRIYTTTSRSSRSRPARTIIGSRTLLDRPVAVALGVGDTLYVANAGRRGGRASPSTSRARPATPRPSGCCTAIAPGWNPWPPSPWVPPGASPFCAGPLAGVVPSQPVEPRAGLPREVQARFRSCAH